MFLLHITNNENQKKTLKSKELINVKLNLIDNQVNFLQVVNTVDINSDVIDVKPLVSESDEALILKFNHSKTNTHLLLTGVSPYVLIYFDESLDFKGASFSKNSGHGNFAIQTQHKTILLVKLPLDLDLNNILKLSYEYENS